MSNAHKPCDKCGSSDALAIYETATHCFSCGNHVLNVTSSPNFSAKTPNDLVDYSECFAAMPLTKRKISQATCQKYNYLVGYHKGIFVHVATHYDKERNICAQKLRYADKTFPWRGDSKSATLFGQHLFSPNANLSITITEGALDALSIAELYDCKWPVVSLKGGAQGAKKELEDQFEYLNGFKEIRLCFDNDEAGKKAIEECVTIPFESGKLKVVKLPLKDASDMLQNNRISELQRCLAMPEIYRPDCIVNAADFTKEMFMGSLTSGFDIPYPDLNRMIRGIHKGRVTLLTSGWGMGKSTLMKELAYHLSKVHGQRVGCLFLEETAAATVQGFMAIHLNTPAIDIGENADLQSKLYDTHQKTVFEDRLIEVYKHEGETGQDRILNQIEYMIVGLKCDFIIFDHITYYVSGMSGGSEGDRKLIDLLLYRLKGIKDRTGAGIITACQLKKDTGGTKANSGVNNGGEIGLQSLKGSGELAGMSDVCIGFEGDQQHPERGNDRTFRVLKNRTGGILGLAGEAVYDTQTGRFLPKIGNYAELRPSNQISI